MEFRGGPAWVESRAWHSPPPKPPRRWLPSGNSAPKGMRPRRNRSSTGANGLGRTCKLLVHTWRGKWPPRPPTPPRRWTPSANSAPKAYGHSGIRNHNSACVQGLGRAGESPVHFLRGNRRNPTGAPSGIPALYGIPVEWLEHSEGGEDAWKHYGTIAQIMEVEDETHVLIIRASDAKPEYPGISHCRMS